MCEFSKPGYCHAEPTLQIKVALTKGLPTSQLQAGSLKEGTLLVRGGCILADIM